MWIEDLTPLVDQGLTFACIMADPAWDYDNKGTRGSTKGHYVTMGFDEPKALPVAQLAAPDCHLHLWTTTPMLPQALTLMAVWGFTYKSKAVWDKELMGQGNYWRVQTEDLLLGVRGEAKHFRRRDLRNVVRVERGQYSRKPDHVRTLIEQASYGPYLELFGREDVEGWTVFGNERISFLLGTTTQPRCAWCDNPFSPKRKCGKYCGDVCRQRAHRAKIA